MQLKGSQIADFREALLNAFNMPSFQRMLTERLDKDVFHHASIYADFQTIVFDVIMAANREGWVDELILKSREAVPKNPKLYAFAQQLGLTSSTTEQFQQLERVVRESNNFLDSNQWLTTLSKIETQVCRIEVETDQGKVFYGTGFLISPNSLITNYHVIEALILGEQGKTTEDGYSAKAINVKCRFDYKRLGNKVLNKGTIYHLHNNWKVDFSPNSPLDQTPPEECLDYAIIRLEGNPGNELVASKTASSGETRGWITLPDTLPSNAFAPNSPLFILQHPQGEPLKIALDTNAIIGLNDNNTRLRYRTNTEPGSSGSPCFTQQLELIALHHSGDPNFDDDHKPTYNEGIPFSAITSLLRKRNISFDVDNTNSVNPVASTPSTSSNSQSDKSDKSNKSNEPNKPSDTSTKANTQNSATNVETQSTNNQTPTVIPFRQGAISTSTTAFILIKGLKQIGGIESVELLAKLHSVIKFIISNNNNYNGIQVLSSLLGAIILLPDSLQLDTINLIININKEIKALGIPIRVGMSRGDIQELIDVDGKSNFIGVAINHSARLATSDKNPGLLVHDSLASHLQAGLRASHWLSVRNTSRLFIEVAGKRDEKFLCYYPPSDIWPTLSDIAYKYDESFQPTTKNAAIISYDLPNFSDGDLNQLSQRFRAITDVFLALVAQTKLPLKYFYFSPGGDGGVMVFTDLDKKPVYDLAKNFAEKLLIESSNKNSLISVECRIGLHYGTVLLYENAEGYLRPTGEDIFIADDLMADKDIRTRGNFIFTQEFKSVVSGGDDKFFFQVFQSVPALNLFSRTIPRYVFKPIAPKLSCHDYLVSLSQPDLYYWIKLNLSPKQIEQVWFALFNNPMDKDIKNNHISHCIIELCNKVQESLLSPDLYKELSKQSQEPYQELPTDNKPALDLIEKTIKEKSTVLDLSCLSLKSLPEQLFTLTDIRALYLAGNQLTGLSEGILSLNNLKYLDLYKNQLTILSNDFGKFQLLEYLNLSHNKLTELPSEFSKLVNLNYLDLSYNHLVSLPGEFGQLNKLKLLLLPYNELTLLPNEFGLLTNIEILDISYNKITKLPNEFGQLKNLHLLYLSNNQLVELPKEFGNLINLKSLYLSANKLTRLPEEFGNLVNLEFLYLSHNQLTQLPIEMAQLAKLQKLGLEENDKELERTIPPEILKLEDTPQKILNFLSDTVKTSLNEVKMLIVGEGKVGKTSLVKRLIYNDFDPLEPMTKGIAIKKQWPLQLTPQRQIKVNIWDFGGQEIMHATHQFFLTKRSLYLLVLDARHDEQQNRLIYWLKTIENFAEGSPIIIVINQIDSGSLELERKKLKRVYPNIKAFIETSCKDLRGLDILAQQIVTELSQPSIVDTLVPYSWIVVKTQLEHLKKDHLEYEDYHQICQQSGLDEQNEETLIDFLHDLGVILCFREDLRIKSDQILNPQWVTTGVYKIITHNGSAIDKGILRASNLSQILDNQYSWDDCKFIIEMMLRFELCFDLEDSNRKTLLIPDLLPKDPPELGNWQDSLRFQYDYDDFLPSSVISRFIVKVHTFIYQSIYWRYGVVIESLDRDNRALIKVDIDKNKIFINVSGHPDSRKILLALIREKFISINKSIPKLKVKEQIPLPEDPTIVFEYEELLKYLEMGEEYVIATKIMKKIPIRPLLEGIEQKPTLLESTKASDLIPQMRANIASSPLVSTFNLDKISDVVSQTRKSINTQLTDAVNPNIISEIYETFDQPKSSITVTKPIHILHLSDLHLGTVAQGNIYYNQLQLDLIQNLKLATLDYLIISGDIANKSTKDEYEAAFKLINQIKLNFGLKDKQIIVAPGNHDLNWDLSEEAYQTHITKRKLPSTLTDAYIPIETGALLRDEDDYKKRFDNFSEFYKEITGNPYPTNYEDQAILHTFTDDRLLVLSLNSAWQIDHHYTQRASINQVALGKALSNININSYQDWLKIAIWHHPIAGQEMMNADFVEQLAVAGFEICMHGHIHQAIEGFHKYDDRRSLAIIGGGTFGAPAKAQVTGIPLQYNLLVLDSASPSITVRTRKKEKVDGAWSADARWGDKENPKPFYTIKLKRSLQQPPIFIKKIEILTDTFEFETVKVNAKGDIIERNKKQAKQIIEDLGNGVVLEMVEIPGGTFMMGSPNKKGYDSEKPQHQVTIPALYIGKYQVTQAQWKAIMGNNPSSFTGDDNLPVEQVSWNDAVEFCKKLSEKTKKKYRLPSEAEWEYACRAGTTTAFAFGETITPDIVNYDGNYPYGEAPKGEYRRKTIPVGSLGIANEFGLYDMHGNVWEWCQDLWHDNYNGAPTDGSAWGILSSNNTNYRVLRGGSFNLLALYCRCADRYGDAPAERNYNVGFRVVMIAQTLK